MEARGREPGDEDEREQPPEVKWYPHDEYCEAWGWRIARCADCRDREEPNPVLPMRRN